MLICTRDKVCNIWLCDAHAHIEVNRWFLRVALQHLVTVGISVANSPFYPVLSPLLVEMTTVMFNHTFITTHLGWLGQGNTRCSAIYHLTMSVAECNVASNNSHDFIISHVHKHESKHVLFYSTAAQQVGTHSLQNICKMPGCNRAAHSGYDCCGITHGKAYKNLQEQAVVSGSQTFGAEAGAALTDSNGHYMYPVFTVPASVCFKRTSRCRCTLTCTV